jgi:hypothetical protein
MRRLVVALVATMVAACASVGVERISYNERIKSVSLGMGKEQLYQLFPEAVPRGAREYPSGVVEVLEVNVAYYSFVPTGNPNRNPWTGMEGQPQWFYFFQHRLIQYGQPNDWPREPDRVIEFRQR